jgi:hypothetical protein
MQFRPKPTSASSKKASASYYSKNICQKAPHHENSIHFSVAEASNTCRTFNEWGEKIRALRGTQVFIFSIFPKVKKSSIQRALSFESCEK